MQLAHHSDEELLDDDKELLDDNEELLDDDEYSGDGDGDGSGIANLFSYGQLLDQ